jgi:hypothetical protein
MIPKYRNINDDISDDIIQVIVIFFQLDHFFMKDF